MRLKNFSNQYYPNNAASPYYPNVLPVTRINVQATYGITTYDIYTGFIEKWLPQWLGQKGTLPVIYMECADLQKNLARFDINDAVGYAEELSGTRFGNVLDDLGWPAGDRDIDVGQTTLQATGPLIDENAMAHLFKMQKTERGLFFVAGNGDATFHDRHARLTDFAVSQAIFGDDAGENRYRFITPSYDDEYLYNDIRITRLGGVQQSAEDATSQATFGKRTYSETGLLMTQDTEAADLAHFLKSQYKDPHLRARTLAITPDGDPANLWPKVLGYDLSTRITVRLNQADIDEEYHIEGISHDYLASTDIWETKWQLSNADGERYWAIGVAGFSEIGETTRVCY